MNKFKIAVLLAFVGCEMPPAEPSKARCAEFDYHTIKSGVRVTCRMLWCHAQGESGVATLWCEEVSPPSSTPPRRSP